MPPDEWPSLITHVEWPLLRCFVRVMPTTRQQLEIVRLDDGPLLQHLRRILTPCVACGDLHHPVRPRKYAGDDIRPHPKGGYFLACACESRRCSRTKVARTEKALFVIDIEAWRNLCRN